jgi:hypothetical protein
VGVDVAVGVWVGGGVGVLVAVWVGSGVWVAVWVGSGVAVMGRAVGDDSLMATAVGDISTVDPPSLNSAVRLSKPQQRISTAAKAMKMILLRFMGMPPGNRQPAISR